jgi:hypothetical protein
MALFHLPLAGTGPVWHRHTVNPTNICGVLPKLSIVALMGAVSLFTLGCASTARQSAGAPGSVAAAKRSADSTEVRYVEVTGSRIPVKVTGKAASGDLPVNLAVVDAESPMNQGYATPLDMLMKNPWASRGYRGR